MAFLGLGFVVLGVMLFLGISPLYAFASIFELSLFSTNANKRINRGIKSHKHR